MILAEKVKDNLINQIIPFWKKMKDDEYGGYYGYMDFDLNIDKKAVKGCILNSRILWFFSNAYSLLKDESLKEYAKHAYDFLVDHCWDKENDGVFWELNYDGTVADDTKHSYCQSFAIYGLSSYYDISKDEKAIEYALKLFHIIETKQKDQYGYLEEFTVDFKEKENDKLSENGVLASKTMNTILHVFEAYTELYRVTKNPEVAEAMKKILDVFHDKIFNSEKERQEVFFDEKMNSIIDLHSYGHDIESAWLLDRGLDVLGDKEYKEKMSPLIATMEKKILAEPYDGTSVDNEKENDKVDTTRVWWVQCESIIGFYNAYQKTKKPEFKEAAENIWHYIETYIIDKREGSEWFWDVTKEGKPESKQPIVEPWKCPYHNGRMCIEIIRRTTDVA